MNGASGTREEEFKRHVLESDLPVLVDFFAPWCGPCRALAPALEDIANAYAGRVNVVKVNVDNSPDLASKFNVSGVPTLKIFKAGQDVDTIIGLPPLSTLRRKLDAVAGVPPKNAV